MDLESPCPDLQEELLSMVDDIMSDILPSTVKYVDGEVESKNEVDDVLPSTSKCVNGGEVESESEVDDVLPSTSKYVDREVESESEVDDSDQDPDFIVSDTDEVENATIMTKTKDTENIIDEVLIETERNLTRKRKRNPENWKSNIRKRLRVSGKEYVDIKGRVHHKKVIKPGCSNTCCFHCSTNFSENDRILINQQFWDLSESKKHFFFSKYVKKITAARKRTTAETSKKKNSFIYFLEINSSEVRVCKIFFLNTLSISQQKIYYHFKTFENSVTSIPRSPTVGKHKKKFTSDENLERVRNHIRSFPTVESHYCRANTEKMYLESGLSIRKLYNLYKEMVESDPVKFHIYSKVFNTEFNFSFYKPKKDQCDKCVIFNLLQNPTAEQILNNEKHLAGKEASRSEKKVDKEQSDCNVAIITYDLQNVFALPKANTSSFFYKRKFNCYNLTAHCSVNGVTYCSLWNENIAGRAGNNIASALIKILKEIVNDNISLKKLILWSDSCVPQNKNSITSLALLDFLNSDESKNVQQIEQKFAEAGHSNLQEIDAVHSSIERNIRDLEIYSPVSLLRVLINIKSSKVKFKVMQLNNTSDFWNYQSMVNYFNFSSIPYTKLKHIVYKKTELLKINYNYTFDKASIQEVCLVKTRYVRKNSEPQIKSLPKISLLRNTVKISGDKIKDIQSMLPCMPEIDKKFYNSMIANNK